MIPNLPKPELNWDHASKVFLKENVLSPEFCESIISDNTSSLAKGVDKYPGVFTTSFHSCLLPLDHPVHAALQETYNEILDFFKFDIDFVEPYELKRYSNEDFFGQHFDNYYCLKENIDRKITVVALLADEASYLGGHLNVLGKSYSGKQGSVIAFPSFFPHKVEPIVFGERWSLIAWLWGNYWK